MGLEADNEKQKMYNFFVDIVNEFIESGAPSEVNISSKLKQRISKYKDSELFFGLTNPQILSIFDEAEKDVQGLLWPVVQSFEQDAKYS